ncbi:hypothetical protein H8B02_20780 [Bradyrhizobium sp. Pear77]|uniref:hypothetical protein n=1 Tax=Bradyrhizobium altum TaxID=1571202 RepID=UPI001E3D7FC4|nr:hypothetical protein [Bradyrhizobium altum]MCC8955780.1 hypothetical protein [Bradyrhizobium altum]
MRIRTIGSGLASTTAFLAWRLQKVEIEFVVNVVDFQPQAAANFSSKYYRSPKQKFSDVEPLRAAILLRPGMRNFFSAHARIPLLAA